MDMFLAILRLCLFALLPPLAAALFSVLERKTKFANLHPMHKKVIAGVVFGGLAVIATEFGTTVNGAVLNVRDAAVVTAGLLYGLPGGLIAGFIGGAERFASAYWNNTFYTQWACSISTLVSGFVAGLLRHALFPTKRPTWAFALVVGLVTETFHILMIFLTNVSDTVTAFSYVRVLGNPMILANMLSATIALGILDILDFIFRDKNQIAPKRKMKRRRPIRSFIAINLSVISVVTITVSGVLTYGLQSSMAYRNSINLLTSSVDSAAADVVDTSDSSILGLARNTANLLEDVGSIPTSEGLQAILPGTGVSEIHYVDVNGIVTASTVPESLNYDMSSGEQSAEFLVLLDKSEGRVTEYVQPFGAISQDASVKKKYAAVSLSFGGFVQVGFDEAKFYASIQEIVTQVVKNRTIGEGGYMLVCDLETHIYSTDEKLDGKTLSELGFPANMNSIEPRTRQVAKILDVESYYMFLRSEGFYIIAVIDVDEIMRGRDMANFLGIYMEIIIFSILFIGVYFLIDRFVLRDLVVVNEQLGKIADGDLDQRLEQNHTDEIAELSESINVTVDSLKEYIAKEASRYDEELAFGKQLQLNQLPPRGAYLFRHDFAVYGEMITAKQVGGDFYDYFTLADKRLAFLIADVSGKGIPAAMFMMKTKSIIKALIENGLPIADIMQRANDRVCEGNETETFVTTWLGICDLATGEVEYVNAGHNPPMLLSHGKYQKLEMKRDLVLGAMPGVIYRKQTLKMEPGDMLFLYTDGITEAEAGPEEFYGEQRLLDFLDANSSVHDPFNLVHIIEKDVAEFAHGHDQSDDMTLVAFAYLGIPFEKRFEFPSTVEGVDGVCAGVCDALKANNIPAFLVDKARLVVEEVAANIAFHAYKGTSGTGVLDLSVNATQIVLTFSDSGPRFNPLEKTDPDITLAAEDRQIGGLGIFMVKKIADKYFYTYQEKRNVFMIIINQNK